MATQQDPMSRIHIPGGSSSGTPSKTERRSSRRCKITQLMRLRPSDPEKVQFEDLRGTLSVSRDGIFFQTSEVGYEVGMRLFVTMPYAQHTSTMSREFLAEVVRREHLPNGLIGIGFKIMMELGMQGASPASGPFNQK
jgi:hypothetical protein